MSDNPNYYGILPASVRYCKGLTPNAKILYTELSALTNKSGYCHATNNYFATLYDVSERAISQWFKELSNFGFIEIQIIKNETGTFRRIFLSGMNESSNGGMNKTSTPYEQNFYTKEYYNNNNINVNNINKNKSEESLILPSNYSDKMVKAYTDFFEYRKEIKKPFKSQKTIATRLNQWSEQIDKYGENAVIESIYNSISNQYLGTFIDKQYLNTQKPIKDDKGNYANTTEGRQQFISNIAKRGVEVISKLRDSERNDFGL